MASLFVNLFRKPLVLCQHWGRQSIRYLLYLYSVLFRRRPRLPIVDGETVHIDKSVLPKFADSFFKSVHDAPIERPIVLACSSIPSAPLPARTVQHHKFSVDSRSSVPLSPTSTLHDSPGAISDVEGSNGYQCFPMGGASQPHGTFTAEPARLVAPPIKPIRGTFPSIAPRYDRDIEMYVCSSILSVYNLLTSIRIVKTILGLGRLDL